MFIKCQPYCKTVELYLKENYPLIVKYNIDDYGYIYLIIPSNQEITVSNSDSDSDDESDDENNNENRLRHDEEQNEPEEEEEQDDDN